MEDKGLRMVDGLKVIEKFWTERLMKVCKLP